MGLSRRQFTKEFKLAAVRRLEQGVSISIGEPARALEVNPNVLHRWRREFRQGPGNVFPGKANRGLTIGRMVELGGVSRASFYRFGRDRPEPDRDTDLRDAIQWVALEWPSYGRPRVTAELGRRGWEVNPKRVYRLMREDNLLCVRKRKFVVPPTPTTARKCI